MIIKKVREQIELTQGPVAKLIKHTDHYKVIVIGLKKGMVWKEHKTGVPATLIVSEGHILYSELERTVDLKKDDDFEIPVNVLHGLLAKEDSICFLIQG
ncbi:hypothetical protein [Mucilaginibacter sp.]|jgi:quercetin dioxygenase-like cupin family protein|uniref:hypothetical protein n=1 Tax=Mucilaginibacter sp. TaxID=1882438 RepID=UPI0025D024BA|nr:hypothetical protein [Mucilaginibacter sp.]